MSYGRYEKYKFCSCDWLIEIPTHWKIDKISMHFHERRTKVSDKDYPPLSVTKKGVLYQLSSAAKSNDGDNRKMVATGDFVINSRSDRKGSSGTSTFNGSVSLINIVMIPYSMEPKYVHHLLKSHYFIEEYYRYGRGIVADLWTTRYSEMRNILIPIPPREEQGQIVRFLDWKLSLINKLIAAKKKQIGLLNEQKQVIINQAVTKGLNADAPLKDSGIDWLGLVPHNWNVLKLKRLCKVNASINSIMHDYSDMDEVVFLPMEAISVDGKIDNRRKMKLADVKSGFTSFAKNDVVVAKITPCFENGKGACLSNLDTQIGYGTTELIVLRAFQSVLPQYLYWITRISQFRIIGAENMTGSAGQKRVSSDFIANFIIAVPPSIEEQAEIIDYINLKTEEFKKAIELTNREMQLITEYRTRLISDVVTGKIDVRDVKVPNDFNSDDSTEIALEDDTGIEEETEADT